MEEQKFSIKNVDKLLKDYSPLINKFSYILYQKYHTVMDFEDAQQEVRMCMLRCLNRYDPKEFKFMTYFYAAFARMKSRYYYSFFHEINIQQHKQEEYFNFEGDSSMDLKLEAERFIDKKSLSAYQQYNIRPHLSSESVEVFDLYMERLKISSWLVAKQFNLSRYFAKQRFDNFKREVAEICKV